LYACSIRGVTQPLVVGSLTEHFSGGHEPSGLRGAGEAEAGPPVKPPVGDELPSAFSASALRLASSATCCCCTAISALSASRCWAYCRRAVSTLWISWLSRQAR